MARVAWSITGSLRRMLISQVKKGRVPLDAGV